MKIPKDISGAELIRKLKSFGYEPTRQSGSHIRLTTMENGEHHLTVPNHDQLRIGTFMAIISDVASHFNLSKEQVLTRLF